MLNEIVRDLTAMLRRVIGENIELDLELEETAGAIIMDPAQVEQVLMNLALNARDAMPSGGR